MELRQLRYFMAVAAELHFGRAAQKLHMSQPPLSLHVSKLEGELGVTLFERSTRRVSLTAAGIRFQDRVRQILHDLDAAAGELRQFADGESGALTAGFVSSANYTVLPGVMQLFRSLRPNVDLSAMPLTSAEQCDRLRDGTLDVGIVRDEIVPERSADPMLSAEVVFEERLVACLPRAHPLAAQPEVTATELSRVPMISYPRHLMPGYVDRVAEVLGSATVRAQTIEEVVHQETALGFIIAGAGTTILPESVRQIVPPSIATVPLAGSPTTRLLAARQRVSHGPAALRESFIACVHDAAAELEPARQPEPTSAHSRAG